MATIEERIKALNEKRMKAWEAGKEILDRAADEGRALTAEERESYDRSKDEVTGLDDLREEILRSDKAAEERENIEEEFRRAFTPRVVDEARETERTQIAEFFGPGHGHRELEIDLPNAQAFVDAYRSGLRGRELAEEVRVIGGDVGASGGSLTIPTQVASTIYQYMTDSTALRRWGSTIITTGSGEKIQLPKVAAAGHGIASQVADQDTAFAGTDPVLTTVELDAYDAGQLTLVARNFVDDSGADVIGFVARQLGRAIGEQTAEWYTVGTGSGQPLGLMAAITGTGAATLVTGGTVNLGGTTVAQWRSAGMFESLIDLQSSTPDRYPMKAWLTNKSTAAEIRKTRDGSGGTEGAFIWQPSPTVGLSGGQPDSLLGDPVFTDAYVAAFGSSVKAIAHGAPEAFYIRDARGLTLERSDDYAFNKNQIAFRAHMRTDSVLIDDYAFNVGVGRV